MKKLAAILAASCLLGTAQAAGAAANPFADVPRDSWAYDAVSQLAADGIIEGYGDGSFRGERAITRYEMAQITAKAMAKNPTGADKALVDKLAAEFGSELNNLGVRVAALERNADNLRFDGFFRLRQEHFGDHNDIDDTSKAYLELYSHARVNEHWTGETKHKITLDMKKDTGDDGNVKTTNIYAYGKYDNFTAKIGKFDTVDGYAYTHEDPMRGVQVTFGKKLKAKISAGRISNPNNYFDADVVSGIFTYPLGKRTNLYAGYYYLKSGKKGGKFIEEGNFGLGNIGFDTLLGKNFRFIALYSQSNASVTKDIHRNGFLLELDYKRMQVQNPGSFMLMLRHLRVTDATAISSRYDAYTHGNICGTEIGGCYAPIKNVEVGAKYFWGKDEVTHDTKSFVRTEIKYFF
ncbi:MAG: S-layer homology domain-containing protein [Selenomonas sp.]|nr:S-layer homology domain-containing protein [Selenomonas sp.]